MSKTTRTSYSKEFKINAVKMVVEEGIKVAEVARELNISPNLIFVRIKCIKFCFDNRKVISI